MNYSQKNVSKTNINIYKNLSLLTILFIYVTLSTPTIRNQNKLSPSNLIQQYQQSSNLSLNHHQQINDISTQNNTDSYDQSSKSDHLFTGKNISLSAKININVHAQSSSDIQYNNQPLPMIMIQSPSLTDINQQHPVEPSQSPYYHPHELQFWLNILIAILLTIVGAFCSGMTVGLMSIQTIQLQIMSLSQNPQEKAIALRILSVTSNHHLFLVTLLLANAIALQTLPIIIHYLMPAWVAILFSTIIVLIAAEIIPQAFCTGSKKIVIAFYASTVILLMIKIFWIVSYPIAKCLDYLLGEHHHHRIQHKDFANFLTGGTQILSNGQKMILTSILQLRTKRVPQIMIPLPKLYMLQLTQKLLQAKILQLDTHDYSYILVYKQNKSNVIGILKMKQFVLKYLQSSKKNLTVQSLFKEKQNILCIYEDTNLLEMLMLFQSRSQRFAIVIGKKRKIQPGVQSIMYSKSDMVSNKQEGEILGVVFLCSLFESIAEYDAQVGRSLDDLRKNTPIKQDNQMEMKEINKPLLRS